MAEANWTIMGASLSAGNVKRGVTAGLGVPNGGGTYIYGFNSVSATPGCVALYTNQAGWIPTALGGTIQAAVKRGPSASPTGYSPFLFIGAQGTSVADNAYMFGLADTNPSPLVLRKGLISAGIVDGELGDAGILAKSAASFDEDSWLHLRVDMIVNPSGDVVLRCYQNNLAVNPVTAPLWLPITGLDTKIQGAAFVDDALGIESGSAPYVSGYMGFGFQTNGLSRRAFFDHFVCPRQV